MNNHLLRGLRSDAAERHIIDLLFDLAAYLKRRVSLLYLLEHVLSKFVDVFVVGDHRPDAEGLVFARFAVYRNTAIDLFFFVELSSCHCKR